MTTFRIYLEERGGAPPGGARPSLESVLAAGAPLVAGERLAPAPLSPLRQLWAVTHRTKRPGPGIRAVAREQALTFDEGGRGQ